MLKKIRILRDDTSKMICTIMDGEVMYEGTFESFPGCQHLADTLRLLGYSVTEEGYTCEVEETVSHNYLYWN